MKLLKIYGFLTLVIMLMVNCKTEQTLQVEIFETAQNGNKFTSVSPISNVQNQFVVTINPNKEYQTITGFGGSFTEASAFLLNKLSKKNREKIIEAYFGESGAKYSLTRTHINSCDFSLSNYSYASEEDKELKNFSIKEDADDIIPMIKEAMKVSNDGFKIIASPWTAPPWMKDNKKWVGGKLLPEHYDTWALFFSKYIDAYKEEGIPIWGLTVENEPLGNGNNWESMHFTPQEMTQFVQNNLGPKLEANGNGNVKILGYDQNREHLQDWVDVMFADTIAPNYFDGTAIHWYASTYEVFPEQLQYAHKKVPNKHLIQTEACVDAEVPKWQDDAWYWKKEATDWGWDWAPEDQKHLHPKYAPVNRYARDIIGCLNNWVDGWVDWNMILDKKGGPNWFENWCVAPVIVDPEKDEVYFTPLYYTMMHFSKYIRPNAKIIEVSNADETLLVTAAKNTDGSIVVIVFNELEMSKTFEIKLENQSVSIEINPQAIQTILIKNKA